MCMNMQTLLIDKDAICMIGEINFLKLFFLLLYNYLSFSFTIIVGFKFIDVMILSVITQTLILFNSADLDMVIWTMLF